MLNQTDNQLLTKLASEMEERRYTKGYLFCIPGDPADTLFLVRAGRIQQYHLSPGGRKLVTNVLEPGDVFGITTLTQERHHHLFAEALDDCVVLTLNGRQAREFLLREPRLALWLIARLTQRLGRAVDLLQALAFESIPVRLAHCLVEMADNGVVEGYTHQDISEFLGTHRENITAALHFFKEQSLIDIERRRITVLDIAGLSRFANGGKTVARPDAITLDGTVTRDQAVLVAEPQTMAA